ncbi:Nephrocystin-3 [Mycena sanguinolenta]|uniref:Nephrocystin-3 n=1 Tax=Mycena sanguinolenta TaxID=230812 RepID=A0A8H7D3F3_9AGAR|nr:Nephrocystin-3 [Mycena sanguinolenta]
MTEMLQQLTLSEQLGGTMLAEHQAQLMQLSISGGRGGPGGHGHPQGIGGAGGTGLGPTVNFIAQQLHLSTLASEEAAQQSKIRAAQFGIHCPPPSRIFQGRQDILEKMHDFFDSNPGTQKIYVLHGLGGAGKTQIALKFIKESSSHFSDMFFIDTSTIATIDTGLKNIAIMKGSGDSRQEGLIWLTGQVQAWILVFDNADDPSINLQKFIPECDHGNIIITSRNPGLCVHAGADSLVSDMEEQDAVFLLLKSAAQMVTAGTEKIATEIVKVRYPNYGHSI